MTEILKSLELLDDMYRNATNEKENLFFSKLAIIELCGWIEETMDRIVLECARRNLKEQKNVDSYGENVVEKTYGFDYKKNFRHMLSHLIGLINVERIEQSIEASKHALFLSTLGALKEVRNSIAHTHIQGTTPSINAPSLTLAQFHRVKEGLIAFEAELLRLANL